MGTPVRHLDVVENGQVAVGVGPADRRQLLPVGSELAGVLPEGGLVRGRIVACTGGAAVSAALALVADATRSGAWLAVVGLPWLGVDAARESGIALERIVRIDVEGDRSAASRHGHVFRETSREKRDQDGSVDGSAGNGGRVDATQWAERVAASVDGFELVLTRVPARVPDRLVRQVRQRLQARGGVLVDVRPGASASASTSTGADLMIDAAVASWYGVGRGSGHLRGREIDVVVSGRRSPRPRRSRWFFQPADGGQTGVEPADVGESDVGSGGR
jgi:hypothetical protein